jgi:N utilization substance protein B
MRARSRARGWALQILYAWDLRAEGQEIADVLTLFMADRRIAEASREYLFRLLHAVADHLEAIDRALDQSLTNWRLDRLSVIDRNVLRIGTAELLYLPDVPPRVAIQEAIVLAEKYGTEESPRFVNGVLDALMRRTRGALTRGDER